MHHTYGLSYACAAYTFDKYLTGRRWREGGVGDLHASHTLPALRTLLSAATVPRTPRTSYTADFGSVPLHILS